MPETRVASIWRNLAKKVTRTFGVRVDPEVVADLRGGNGTKIEWFFECQKPVIL